MAYGLAIMMHHWFGNKSKDYNIVITESIPDANLEGLTHFHETKIPIATWDEAILLYVAMFVLAILGRFLKGFMETKKAVL